MAESLESVLEKSIIASNGYGIKGKCEISLC